VFPIDIEIHQLTPQKGFEKLIHFSSDGIHCSKYLSTKKPALPTLIDAKVCKEIIAKILSQKEIDASPSDFINPKLSYYEVIVTYPDNKLSQTLSQLRFGSCSSEGQCTEPSYPFFFQIADLLVKKIKVSNH
jgi:hypothetical protein